MVRSSGRSWVATSWRRSSRVFSTIILPSTVDTMSPPELVDGRGLLASTVIFTVLPLTSALYDAAAAAVTDCTNPTSVARHRTTTSSSSSCESAWQSRSCMRFLYLAGSLATLPSATCASAKIFLMCSSRAFSVRKRAIFNSFEYAMRFFTSICFSLRSYICVIFSFSCCTRRPFSMENSSLALASISWHFSVASDLMKATMCWICFATSSSLSAGSVLRLRRR
mmetsp:Transcript_154979/g.476081  ORF Transcript_154979/g.476081 Transcript_154979/m.476081 type:complete len:224 (+) Transcript_154979:75-746(+)